MRIDCKSTIGYKFSILFIHYVCVNFYLFFFFFILIVLFVFFFFFFQAEDGIRDRDVTGVQTCALPISPIRVMASWARRSSSGRRRSLGHASTPGGAVASHARAERGVPKLTAARP